MAEIKVTMRSIKDCSEIGRLVSLSGKSESTQRWVEALLGDDESRPSWCRMAICDEELLAAHVFDSWSQDGPPGDVPLAVLLLGHTDDDIAVDMLNHDLERFGAVEVESRVVEEADATSPLAALKAAQRRVLLAAGFELEVARVRLSWPTTGAVRAPIGRLAFRPSSSLPRETMVRIFAETGDNSVDHGMRTLRAEVGRDGEADRRLSRAERRTYPDDWFAVGVDEAGEPVGYVQSSMLGAGRAALAELGVIESKRGHRYAGELLAYGTAVVQAAGVHAIVSDTDRDNIAMRNAFARAGYEEFATRDDYLRKAGS